MDAGSGSNSGSADGGGDGGSPTGGTGTEGSGGPSASNDCTGLPASSDPGAATVSHFIWLRDSTGVDSCSSAVASGTGTVALTMQAYHSQTIDFVSSSGTLLASTPGAEGSTLIAGESGFIGNMTASMASWLEARNELPVRYAYGVMATFGVPGRDMKPYKMGSGSDMIWISSMSSRAVSLIPRTHPTRAWIRRTRPVPIVPDVMAIDRIPIAFDPHVLRLRRRQWSDVHDLRWRWRTDVNSDRN